MIDQISVPGRWCMAGASAVFVGVVAAWWIAVPLSVALLAVPLRIADRRSRAVIALLLVAGVVSGSVSDARAAAKLAVDLPDGSVVVEAVVVRDPVAAWGDVAVVRPVSVDGMPWSGPNVAASPLVAGVEAGDTIRVVGTMHSRVRRIRTEQVAGTLRVASHLETRSSGNPFMAIGNQIRGRVRSTFGPATPASALATGLLIGDTAGVPAAELNDLRRSGLSHYVAVSGSNVAMFLLAWWFIGAPIAIRPRLRVAYGLVGLVVFAVATRWEPSVIRASVMAAVPLVGGLVGVPVDPWMALGTAVTILLLVSAELATSVGFLLSVLATGGVLIGVTAVRGRKPSWLWISLGATIGAQVAVSPLLLAVFGSIPLAAPLANLVAAPVVSITSFAAMIGVVVPALPLTSLALGGSQLVLHIARIGSGGPQLGTAAAIGVAAVAILVIFRPTRVLGMAVLVVVVVWTVDRPAVWPLEPTATVLDVGQGDAILLQDPSKASMLIDGGSDPAVLDVALRRNGVRSVDLVVVTHGDMDHAGGLVDLVGAGRAGAVWVGSWAPIDGLLGELIDRAEATGTPVREVAAGTRAQLGSMSIEVLGPTRRYKSDNDGSVVLLVEAGRSLLLPGDVEAVAQSDLPPVRPDVLVVPHHGSATTDLGWLAATVQDDAVLSYGPNRHGHPHPDIVALLEELGVMVRHTATAGDVSIPLGLAP